MDDVTNLVELLKTHISSDDEESLYGTLRSDAAKSGFTKLYSILKQGFGNLELEQIRAIISVLKLVVFCTRSLSVDKVEPIVIATVQQSIEFAITYLESSKLGDDDLHVQNDIILLLELSLLDGIKMEFDFSSSLNLVGLIPISVVQLDGSSLKTHTNCGIQGASFLREKKGKEQVLQTLSYGYVQPEDDAQKLSFLRSDNYPDRVGSLSQTWGVVHMGCFQHLLMICKESFGLPDVFDEKSGGVKKILFSLRILKLLHSLAKAIPFVEHDKSLLEAVALSANSVPKLFRYEVDCVNSGALDSIFETVGLSVLEEFLLLIRIIFCNSSIFQNVQACIIASFLDIWDSDKLSYNKSASKTRTPLAYFPRVVIYVLELLEDVKRRKHHALAWKEHERICPDLDMDYLSCYFHSAKVLLMKQHTVEELVNLIFPMSIKFVDNLMHLLFFLHSEGEKLWSKLDKSCSNCMKPSIVSEPENTACHEDEALFGDLFSEGRSVGSTDGYDQPPVSVISASNCSNMPFSAALELLDHLKTSVFVPESYIYEEGCKQLKKDHIDYLLSIINCESCLFDKKTMDSGSSSLQQKKTIGKINEICFQLLQNLVTQHALSNSLEEYLVDRILGVDNGRFIYSDQALVLVAHTLICRMGPVAQLTTNIYRGYITFINEKVRAVLLSSISLRELLPVLPTVFHVEILLLGFHLSSTDEKETLAKMLFSTLRDIDIPTDGSHCTQLSCWALLVSRLVLVLRHMMFHPTSCPPSLLLDLRSKLRNSQLSGLHNLDNMTDHSSFWTSVVENVMDVSIREDPFLGSLLNQLIDFAAFSSSITRDDSSDQSLSLSWDDVYTCFARIVGCWKGKKAETVEDLVLERHIFVLCWDIPAMNTTADHLLPCLSDSHIFNLSNLEHLFHFRHLLLRHCSNIGNVLKNPDIVLTLLQDLDSSHISADNEELGWNFSRSAMWLSLLLSLLSAGICGYAMKNNIRGVDHLSIRGASDVELLNFSEGLILNITEADKVGVLLQILASLLEKCLKVYQKAFLSSFGDCQSSLDSVLPFLLLKSTVLDKSMQDELLNRCRWNSGHLESLYELLHKLDGAVAKRALVPVSKMFWESMLHGFPSLCHPSSGLLLSSVLITRSTVCLVECLLKVNHGGNTGFRTETILQILKSIMIVKSDKIFARLHSHCEAISAALTTNLENLNYSSIFFLKEMEMFLRHINAGETRNCSIHEWVVNKTIDAMDVLRRDPSDIGTLKFYLGAGDVSEQIKGHYGSQQADLMVLVDSLENCFSESVNTKVLNFFTDLISGDLSPDMKRRVQNKFLGMNLSSLSKWLEIRLLGCSDENLEGVASAKGSSVALRESVMRFLTCLVSPQSESHAKEVHGFVFEALLLSLNVAFETFDFHTAKSYYNFIVQLSRNETSLKRLMERTLTLMQKLAREERQLQGLKFLFGFLGNLFSECGSSSSIERSFGKSFSGTSLGVVGPPSSGKGSREHSGSVVLTASQEGVSIPLDCDATSVDEDDDDGTSDGEVASSDKDEEDDAISDKALASKVCTYTSSGSNFMEQHWYFCYTCDLTVSKGCCSVCAKVCHRGHRVVYSRSSRFFCDCGAGGVRGSNCQCLKPRKFTGSSGTPARSGGSSSIPSFLLFNGDGDHLPDSDSDLDEGAFADMDNSVTLSIPRELQERIPSLLEELDVEGRVLEICSSVLPYVVGRREANLCKGHTIILGEDKVLSFGVELLQLKKAYKSGSLDLKIKTDYTNAKEIKSLIASGSLVKSLLSVSVRGRLAVGEGDKVSIFDVGQLIGQATAAPVTADKANVKPLSKNIVRFEILHLSFNPVVENYLAVAGYEDFQILTVSHRGEVTDRLAVELALQGAYIRRVDWVPGSQVQLMVVTNKFVKVYDVSEDNISPIHYFTLPDSIIVDASLFVGSQGRLFLVVLSENGSLFKLDMSMESDVGARKLTEKILVKERDVHAKGSSLYFSPTYKLLFISYQDGASLIGRLNPEVTYLTEVSSVNEDEQDGKLRPAGLHYWKELLVGSGLFVCISSAKSNSALAISMGAHDLLAQNVRHAVGSSSPLVGITAYKPLSKDKIHCLVLHDDGSLQIYSHVSSGVDALSSMTSDKVKKLGPGILNNKNFSGSNPEFPLDFFEKTVCITADVKFGGDTVKNGDSEGAKQSLASEDGYLESPSPAGFKITVSNSNPDIVMVGFRVHVGNTSANHIPSSIYIFQRVINLDEGMRSWYDIPFTVAESLLADEEFTISVGTTLNGSFTPRIDSLEVYGRAKDEFGWREKMDAILDLEARALGCSSWSPGSGKKFRFGQSTPIQEQVVADGIRLLSKVYGLCRPLGCSRVEEVQQELGKMRCLQVLETIFESDREPLLRAAACCVLQIAFPKREIYYQVKDTMRLSGVLKCTSTISSRLGVGGTTGEWIIEEFTAQMRAVSKIAVHRRSSLAMFLEVNGPEVVDGLMKVLWGILDIEQPDTQTMNNIVISSVELIYCYAECLALHGKEGGECSVAPAVVLLRKLLLSSNEAVQTSSSLAIASRLLQVPFPKQTMIASDEAENVATAPVRNDTPGGNSQVMIEEDSITSSVQYCCDGCSTVPILRRRWHCTICPDFDLCESCYEVLDANRLLPPHSRDHPMTAMPIEVETIGGDGNEVHFTADEFNESTMLQMPEDSGFQNFSTPIHVLEHNESGQFSASVIDPGSISASKQAVNSLLLSELLVQVKGWMETTSGIRAIPVIQLFYRLSSAVGGPFIHSLKSEGLDLQELIKWFLEEINLNKPFVARNRSSFGEVSILVFMFFTLMLRNWHQPGTDGATSKSGGTSETHDRSSTPPSVSIPASSFLDEQGKNDFTSQLIRACSTLRQQAFVNYLMDILQQLVTVFKSPAVNFDAIHGMKPGSGCGALLTVRRELPAGNFSPFFSDSYVKAHRSDMFIDYHRLLLENTFRLVYSLIRPEKQEKSGEKEKVHKVSYGKDLKLDGYQDVLCSYINNSHTTFVRRYARRLFLHLCGSKTQYYSVRDTWQFSSEVKQLYKHINKSGGFQNPASYERSVKIVKCLSIMAEVAAARPRNWQKYCLKHGDVLSFMVSGIFHFGEEFVIQTLKLLNLAFYSGKDMSLPSQKPEAGVAGTSSNKSTTPSADSKKKKKGEDGNESSSEKSYMDMESVVDIFSDKGGDVLRQFIDCFLLEWNSSSVRTEAKCVLHGAWHHGKLQFKEALLMNLLQKVKFLPIYGQNIIEYTELVTWLLGKTQDNSTKNQVTELVDRCLTADIIKCIFETLHSQNELLANHPNSRIYTTLSGLVEFDGYYIESEPCVACSSPEVPYSRMKLESLKSETKFTDNRIIVKCTGSYTIQTVTMNVHDARKSKSVKVLNLYYNNRPVADLSELKNNWSLWRRAKSCHLSFNQTELKVEFPIPITACNFMIELDSFYENLQALSLEPLQCPRCSRPVTDKHGICSNCHENAYQCRQCRNINYENLDSFLCNECGYSKYGRFEFNFTAKPSFSFDNIENEDDMKRGLTAIESESENAHRRYQQLLGFKKPLLKIVSSIGENEMDSQQKDSFQQMMVSLPGPSCKINRKIALLGVLYGEKCKAAFDSVSKSVQTLQGLRRVLMNYLHHKHSDDPVASKVVVPRTPYSCYGCAATFVTQCLEMLQVLSKHPSSRKQLVSAGILSELFENNIHQGPKAARVLARAALCAFSEGDVNAVTELNTLVQKKVMYCLEHHHSMDIAQATREEMLLLSDVFSLADEFWESRLRLVFQLLFASVKLGAKHPAVSEHVILPCLRIVSQACTPPKPETVDKEQVLGKSTPVSHLRDEKSSKLSAPSSGFVNGSKAVPDTAERVWDSSQRTQDMQLLSYSEWEKGASYLDFVRRQYKVSQSVKGLGSKSRSQRSDFLALKYGLRWKRRACKTGKSDISTFELGSWVTELVLSPSSQAIRSEMCMLISLLCAQSSSRRYRMLNLLIALLPATLCAGESAAEYFDLLFKMIDTEEARLFLTAQGCLSTLCKLISQEVGNIESLERSLHIDISQGFILHKLIEILGKFLEVPNIRSRFMRDNLLSDVLEALIVIRGLIVQKTKLISDCNQLLKDLLDSLLVESSENKRQFIRACISGLQLHGEEKKGRTSLFIFEQLCNLICPSKPESVYLLILNKAHTQEEFIRGSMTKNPYSSSEIGPLMRDVKNKICHQLDLLGLLEDDYGMELLVAGNIISLDLSIAQVCEQVWRKSNSQSSSSVESSTLLSSNSVTSSRESSPMIVTYRLQGLDGEATEPMIKELEEDREETQDPEIEFAIAGTMREYGGLEIVMGMIQRLRDDLKSNQEQLVAVLNLLMLCCKIRENRRALLRLGALGLLLETARRAFSVDAMEPAEGILLIVESLTMEANESDNINITESGLTVSTEETGSGQQAKKIVLMFLERLSHPSGLKKSNKQQRNTEMVARILPYLTYGETAAMEALIQHFEPYLLDWCEFDRVQEQSAENSRDEAIALQATKKRFAVENFVRVSESLKTSSCGERLKDIIIEKGITAISIQHLRNNFAVTGQVGFKSTAEWAAGLKLPSVPLILSMLKGLSMGHLLTQKCIEDGGILPLLHALEGVSGENEIGARAENLLDTLSDKEGKGDGFLGEKILSLRHATRDEKRRKALQKREELLQGLGMRRELSSDGGERIVVSRPFLEGLEDVAEEEDGLACMVCREGYSLRPSDLLGVYSYSKRVNLGVGNSGSARGECVYTTVSHFNIIHFQCHQEAKRADAALKNPKKEWEGATLRNNETLCNSLFPLRGPSVPMTQYTRYVDQYWDNLNALGRADGSRLRLLTYDIVLMLARFATGASFSADSKGGGRESNSRFLPFMIQMAHYLLDQGSLSQRRSLAKSVSAYISSSGADSKPSTASSPGSQQSSIIGTEETVQFMMVNSVLSESYESWLQHRRAFLQRGIYHAYMQHTHGRPTPRASASPIKSDHCISSSGTGESELLPIVQPMLVYTGLIEQLQKFFKVTASGKQGSMKSVGTSSTRAAEVEEESGSLEGWEVAMKEKLLDVKEMVGFSKELLSWLEEMTSATDLQEAFDIIGVLADVLSQGFSRCEDFVHAAIESGKS